MKRNKYEANPTARWWQWENSGWVKLSLRPGEHIRHSRSSKDEEGYSWSCEEYHYNTGDREIVCEWANGGRDCDGEVSQYGTSVCPIDRLAVRLVKMNGHKYTPAWERLRSSQRDQFAEAAGY